MTRRGLPVRVAASVPLVVAGFMAAVGCPTASAQVAGAAVYKCPGNLYTDALSAKEAKDKGCRTLENTPITIVPAYKPRAAGTPVPAVAGASQERVNAADQKARDSEARRILDDELRRAQDRLNAAQAEYNNGQPERRGDERNYQKYLDRTEELKSDVARKESDVAALKREIAKLPP